MTTDAPFGRVLTAMATAFHDDGSVDLDGTARIAAHLVDHGHDGVVVSGTTGESPTTSVAEDGDILRAVKDAVGDRASVVAGVGTNATAHSVELAQQAEKIGADGLLLVTPYYNKPSQPGVLHHFGQVVRASDVPVMLYDVPGRTGTTIAMETYRARQGVGHRRGGQGRGGRLRPRRPADPARLRGLLRRRRRAPSAGSRTAAAVSCPSLGHVAGDQIRAMMDAWFAGDAAGALETYTRMLPAIDAVMGVANYGATTAKAALQLLGVLDNRNVRSPLVPLDDDEVEALRAGLVASGLL